MLIRSGVDRHVKESIFLIELGDDLAEKENNFRRRNALPGLLKEWRV
jgi:hypothetical protein